MLSVLNDTYKLIKPKCLINIDTDDLSGHHHQELGLRVVYVYDTRNKHELTHSLTHLNTVI